MKKTFDWRKTVYRYVENNKVSKKEGNRIQYNVELYLRDIFLREQIIPKLNLQGHKL